MHDVTTRRDALRWLAVGATALVAPFAFAAYPDKPIRLVVGYPPGGANDIVARHVAARLGETLGAQVVVDNRPGANGIIACEQVAKAAPDGYTLLWGGLTTLVLNPLTYPKLPYDTLNDFTPISTVSSGPVVVSVRPELGVSDMKELFALAKSKPATINFATVGTGGSTRIFFELMKATGNVDVRYVPYKGAAPAITDIVGGQGVDGIAVDLSAVLPFVKSGKLRALGVTSERRNAEMPNVRTMAEQGLPELSGGNWFAVLGPAKLPPALVATLHGALVKVVASPDFKEKLVASGSDPLSSDTPEALKHLIKSEFARWGRVVKAANIQSE